MAHVRLLTKLLSAFACVLLMGGSVAQTTRHHTESPAFTEGVARLQRERVEASAAAVQLRAVADRYDSNFHIGTGYFQVDLQRHRCYALGALLGRSTAVAHLRVSREAPSAASSTGQAHDLRIKAQSMDNFVGSVDAALEMQPDERVITWNLDCVAQHSILGGSIAQDSKQTFYLLTNEGAVLRVLGAVESGFARKLREAIERNPEVKFIALGSPGGSVYEAISAGRYIRSKGLETVLWNNCLSACPLVFLGGKDRLIYAPYPSLGFHQIYSSAGPAAPTSKIYTDVRGYLEEMGIPPQLVISSMLAARPEQMLTIEGTDTRLCEAKVATWIQRLCSAN